MVHFWKVSDASLAGLKQTANTDPHHPPHSIRMSKKSNKKTEKLAENQKELCLDSGERAGDDYGEPLFICRSPLNSPSF